eukprot:272089_1
MLNLWNWRRKSSPHRSTFITSSHDFLPLDRDWPVSPGSPVQARAHVKARRRLRSAPPRYLDPQADFGDEYDKQNKQRIRPQSAKITYSSSTQPRLLHLNVPGPSTGEAREGSLPVPTNARERPISGRRTPISSIRSRLSTVRAFTSPRSTRRSQRTRSSQRTDSSRSTEPPSDLAGLRTRIRDSVRKLRELHTEALSVTPLDYNIPTLTSKLEQLSDSISIDIASLANTALKSQKTIANLIEEKDRAEVKLRVLRTQMECSGFSLDIDDLRKSIEEIERDIAKTDSMYAMEESSKLFPEIPNPWQRAITIKFSRLNELIFLQKKRLLTFLENESLAAAVEKFGSIANLMDLHETTKKENDILRQREKRFLRDSLLRRRKLNECSPQFLQCLVKALQNELSSAQNVFRFLEEDQQSTLSLIERYSQDSEVGEKLFRRSRRTSLSEQLQNSSLHGSGVFDANDQLDIDSWYQKVVLQSSTPSSVLKSGTGLKSDTQNLRFNDENAEKTKIVSARDEGEVHSVVVCNARSWNYETNFVTSREIQG